MSSNHRWSVSDDVHVLGQAIVSISSATTSNFDFGTPNDINLASASGPGSAYEPGDRILVVLSASTGGTTDTVSFSIQDAPDSAGSIGTPATAVTSGTLSGGTGDQFAVASVYVQNDRPWVRVRVTSTGATDTFDCVATVLGIPSNL